MKPHRDTLWWGWGAAGEKLELDEEALGLLRERVGEMRPRARPGEIGAVALPEPEPLPAAVIAAAGGEDALFASAEDRLRHAGGRGYVDLARLWAGRPEGAPDAVIAPHPEAIGPLLEACAAAGVAVIPFGGGTSVVGGLAPLRGSHRQLISLDLCRSRAVEVDRRSLTARLGAGLRGPEAEAALAEHGLTLGHFPQSFEYATVGGFAAARSAGQASSGYGRFDDLVSSIRLLTPSGELATLGPGHSAAGPALREVIVGSEGALGVIPDVTVRVRPAPARRRYEGWMAESFEAGSEIVRALAQGPGLPTLIRVSDAAETEISLALSGPRGLLGAALDRYLGVRRRRGGALIVVGYEGDEESVARRRALTVRELRAGGAAYLGRGAGDSWLRGRYHGPYLRDALMARGALVETLETATSWRGLAALHRDVGAAIESALAGQGTPGIVFAHLSHAYPDGASLYFTFIAAARAEAELEQWSAVKEAASEAIVAGGGTISHHHGVGRDHLPYMEAEVGSLGVAALRELKARLDPAGIMNPGKLIPGAAE